MRGFIKSSLVIGLFFVPITNVIGIEQCTTSASMKVSTSIPDTPVVLAAYQAWHGLCDDHNATPYDSQDPDVISKQIQKAKALGIDGFVVDWYGKSEGNKVDNEKEREFVDQATAELFKQAEESNFKVALMYDEGTILKAHSDIEPNTELNIEQQVRIREQVQSDLSYAEKFYSSPAYLRINHDPALFIFSYEAVDKYIDWKKVQSELDIDITLLDKDPNTDADKQSRNNDFDGFYAWVYADWDAVGKEWGEGHLTWFYSTMTDGIYANKTMIGGVWAGFDDLLAPWGEHRYISRQNGAVYDKTWDLAVKNSAKYVLIGTWNDFEEGTDIEFGVEMIVDMEDPDPDLLVRSSPIEIVWNPSRGKAQLKVYEAGIPICEEQISSGAFLSLESGAEYEVKIWVPGSVDPIGKWIKIRSQDPRPSPLPKAHLESPSEGSTQSGIGLIRGWTCDAGVITVSIDGKEEKQVVYGNPRGDTLDKCGDRDNGFELLWNWNNLGDGEHTIRVFADGMEFDSTTFTVATLGAKYLRNLEYDFTLPNFPHTGESTRIKWSEEAQNFVITGFTH